MEVRAAFNQSLGVVIGIDDYANGIRPLRTARNDAALLAQTLQDQHGYTVRLLLDQEATREQILDLVEKELPTQVGPDDRVLFYFAGHGVAIDDSEGPNGYLLPCDAKRDDPDGTFIQMPRLHDALTALDCRHMLIVLDSCFGGAFRWSATRDMLVAPPKVIHQERFDRFVHDPAWQVITSASHSQTALDELTSDRFGDRGEEGEHSPFAVILHEVLSGGSDLVPEESQELLNALRADGVFTATELYLYLEQVIQPETIEAGNRQTPGFWPLTKHDKGEYVFGVPGHELNLPPAPPLTYDNNPYRGLSSYDKEHAQLFFGRDSVIEELSDHVDAHPLTLVLGASGTGKSSVVKAGVLPTLERSVEQEWQVLPVMRPGTMPLRALARAFAELDTPTNRAADIADQLEGRLDSWCAAHEETRLVLVIDQFEEMVTMVRSEEDRETVLAILLRLLEAHPKQLRVVLTLRTDFEPQFAETVLENYWEEARYIVPPMTREDLRAVIEEPAALKVLYFRPSALIDTLLEEVVATPGALPLLSFTLSEMYIRYVDRQSDDRSLTEEDYAALGGVIGALRSRADAEFESLDIAQQSSMRRAMMRMVSFEEGKVARQRVLRTDLEYPDPGETERVNSVVDRLSTARLLVEGQEEGGEAYVEPAHDALVRAWDRLIGWIHEEDAQEQNLRYQQHLARAAREWEGAAGKKVKKDLLWRGPAQASVLAQLLKRNVPWMNTREVAFTRSSIRRRRNIRLGLAGLFTIIAGVGIATAILAFSLNRSENHLNIMFEEADSLRVLAEDAAEVYEQQRDSIQQILLLVTTERERADSEQAARQIAREKRDEIFLGLLSGASFFSVQDALSEEASAGAVEPMNNEWTTLIEVQGQGKFAVARLFGDNNQGRVLAAGHDKALSYRDENDNALFLEIALMWLQGERGPKVLFSTDHTEAFRAYAPDDALWLESKLISWDYSVEHVADLSNAEALSNAAVLIIGNAWGDFTTAEIAAVQQFVAEGGGLYAVGLGWSWQAYGPVPGGEWNDPPISLGNYPMNDLMEPFEMRWTGFGG